MSTKCRCRSDILPLFVVLRRSYCTSSARPGTSGGAISRFNFGRPVPVPGCSDADVNQSIFFGAYFRAVDSGDLILGINYNRLKTAISYDINYSGLSSASNYKGGVELAIIYIIPYPKKLPKFKFCPVH